MNIEPLRRRIEQLRERIPPKKERERASFKMHLFTIQEQERIQNLLDLLEPHFRYQRNGMLDLRDLSVDERDQLQLWAYLEDALEHEDIANAAMYRRRLAMSREHLVAAFLAIDETMLPDYEHAPVVAYGKRLYRTYYRSDRGRIERALQCNRLHACDLDDMRTWVEAFAA